jgi:hypothetical protein
MKKALTGPAKPTAKAKKLPERRAMIAAARKRLGAALGAATATTRRVDRAVARRLERVRPPAARWLGRMRVAGVRLAKAAWKRLRPLLVLFLRGFSRAERWLLRARDAAIRGATRASAAITPRRAVAGVVIASAACLTVAQFVAYRGVEVGQPGYAGLPGASPPTVAVRAAGEAHAYLLVPVALLAAIVAALTMHSERRGLGRIVIALGLLSLAVILLVDLPAGLDAGAQASRFSGATAVLRNGFYAELAAAAGLLIGGLLYYARPCRIRTSWSGRAASARRRRRRRRGSSPRKAARRSSLPRSGAASAPASRP